MHYIAFDSHQWYTLAPVEGLEAGKGKEARLEHKRGTIREFLSSHDPGSPLAVESLDNWYWIVDEIKQAGMDPRLVHARKAKLIMGKGHQKAIGAVALHLAEATYWILTKKEIYREPKRCSTQSRGGVSAAVT